MLTAPSPHSVTVTIPQRREREAMLRRPTLAAGLVQRARAILLLAEGH